MDFRVNSSRVVDDAVKEQGHQGISSHHGSIGNGRRVPDRYRGTRRETLADDVTPEFVRGVNECILGRDGCPLATFLVIEKLLCLFLFFLYVN